MTVQNPVQPRITSQRRPAALLPIMRPARVGRCCVIWCLASFKLNLCVKGDGGAVLHLRHYSSLLWISSNPVPDVERFRRAPQGLSNPSPPRSGLWEHFRRNQLPERRNS